MTAKFELFKDTAGQFRFHLKAANGEIIAASQGYTSKAAAQNGIDSIKANAATAPTTDLICTPVCQGRRARRRPGPSSWAPPLWVRSIWVVASVSVSTRGQL